MLDLFFPIKNKTMKEFDGSFSIYFFLPLLNEEHKSHALRVLLLIKNRLQTLHFQILPGTTKVKSLSAQVCIYVTQITSLIKI